MVNSSHTNSLRYLPATLIIFIGAIYCFLSFNIPLLGDDLGFYSRYVEENDCWYALPRFMYRQWLWNNGRFADMLSPLWLNILPLWLTAVITGLTISALYFFTIRLADFDKKLSSIYKILIIFIISFTFRWDAIWMEFMTIFGYVYSSAFALAALWLLLSRTQLHPLSALRSPLLAWLAIPFCFIATAMHEALGFPLASGLVIYFLTSKGWKELGIARKMMAAAVILGGIFPLTSAPSWNRVGAMLQPEPIWEMLLTSAWWLCILIAAVIVIAIRNPQQLLSLIRSPWIIFTTASLLSCGFMIVSGFGGRTGWFCQLFALIALFQILPQPKRSGIVTAAIGWLMAVAIVFHFCAVAVWQYRLAEESRQVIDEYKNSPDGIVYFDYIDEPDLPWYLLRKTHGVPDDDDSYYRYRMGLHYGHGKPLIILPTKAQNLQWESLSDSIRFGKFIISPDSLGNTYPDAIVEIFPRRMLKIEGKEYIQIPFRKDICISKEGPSAKGIETYYLYSPVDRDPGEK